MTCHDCTQRLDDFDDGRLAPDEAAAVRLHLDSCPACRALAVDVARIRAASGKLGAIEPPAGVWARVSAAVGAHPLAANEVEPRSDWRQWLAAAASVALVVSILAWVGSKLGPAGPVTDSTTVGAGMEASEEFQLAEAAYQSAIDSLEPIAADADAPVLTEPALVAVHASLDALDQTIGEARERLTQMPDDQISQDLLLSALESKMALLQDTVALLDESGTAEVNQ
jgi:anti-sigma factor RsiW